MVCIMDNSDVYSRIAKKYNVERNIVKSLAIPHIYSLSAASKTDKQIEDEVENSVKLYLAYGGNLSSETI